MHTTLHSFVDTDRSASCAAVSTRVGVRAARVERVWQAMPSCVDAGHLQTTISTDQSAEKSAERVLPGGVPKPD